VRVLALIVRAGAVVAVSAFVFSLLVDGASRPATAAQTGVQVLAVPVTKPAAKPKPVAVRAPRGVVAIVATGDIVMGATPNLPPDGGRSFFSDVQADLAGDVVLGNLEGTLSTGGSSKCGPDSTACFAFRTPPSYARWLVQAGFTVMNLANNHAFDFGAEGQRQTIAALDRVGLSHTGRPGQVTVQRIGQIRVALVGFASYRWAAPLTDIAAAKGLVRKASRLADVVIVTMHAGAEGSDRQHVARGVEVFLGENRGDVVRFAHAVVDAGADLVVGHGPHVLRGMEWYKRRLIAYSATSRATRSSRSAGRSPPAGSCGSPCGVTAPSRRGRSCRRASRARGSRRSIPPRPHTASSGRSRARTSAVALSRSRPTACCRGSDVQRFVNTQSLARACM
jgi:Bacterial capsule synthesis protein PGA_cap